MILKSFLLGNPLSLCMKIINSVKKKKKNFFLRIYVFHIQR
nr:hypothetical chloroplast RF1 [Geodorum eulophioides]QVH34407.1 hypothetical chloroplast RF1 [Geodorum eulophioides]